MTTHVTAEKSEAGHAWPERMKLRDTNIHADEGQRIYTTATGHGYEQCRYVREDIANDMLAALELVRSIIVEGATVGFNPLEGGDWAERLYLSQRATAAAVKKAGGNVHPKAEGRFWPTFPCAQPLMVTNHERVPSHLYHPSRLRGRSRS